MKGKYFPLLLATVVCGAAVTTQAALVHESDFDEIDTAIDPVAAGDVTAIHANGTHVVGHPNGFYDYPGDGTLVFQHPTNEWDDSMFEYDTTGIVGAADPVEFEYDFDTNFLTTAGTNSTVEILLTDPGQSYGDAKTNADAIFWFHTDGGTDTYINFVAGGADANSGKTLIPQSAANINTVKVVINHDPVAGEWHAYYSINGGSLYEAPSSPVTAARTTTAFRAECDNTPWAGTMDSWQMIAQNLRIYDSIETTGPAYVTGEVLKQADFNEAAGSIAGNFWLPISAEGLAGMYVPTPATHEYNGTAWVISHDGSSGVNPNASIATFTEATDPVEFVLDIDPDFATDGVGQMVNFKVDGADASMYVANTTGSSTGISIIFGESSDVFNPDPSNVATLVNDASTLTSLRLIINYDPVTQEYNGFYAENGGSVVVHPGSPVVKARTDNNIEFQWQVWNSGGTTPFSIGMNNYEEQYGVSTVNPFASVEDFMLLE
ncbi:MAG: hypothetical protein PWP23_392 [Candidatus Sumerlaeota bacterium]|nr:hypothetical protein [Candidatus Sumerlaeota bacterium]